MVDATAPGSHAFRLGLGHPVLELVATLAGRHREPVERLATPADFTRWLALAGIGAAVDCDGRRLAEARELREGLYRVITAARESRRPAAADVDLINAWARRPLPSPQLDASLAVSVTGPDACRAALTGLARAGIELVAGVEFARIRNCADPECSLMFIDHSRPGRRRWCSMERCGNRAKTARYRERRRASA